MYKAVKGVETVAVKVCGRLMLEEDKARPGLVYVPSSFCGAYRVSWLQFEAGIVDRRCTGPSRVFFSR